MTCYDQLEGKHILLNFVVGQQCNQQQLTCGRAPNPLALQGGNTEYKALLMDLAQKLGHIIDGEPDPRLGTLGSIKHADHPELWQHWFEWKHLKTN